MKPLLSSQQIIERMDDIKLRLLHIRRVRPKTLAMLSKDIGITRPTLFNFLEKNKKVSATTLYLILNYIEKIEEEEFRMQE